MPSTVFHLFSIEVLNVIISKTIYKLRLMIPVLEPEPNRLIRDNILTNPKTT